ncbi:MAG: ribulose-phosphate 3-epimerase [Clostridia bacterium]|nr:ribulose-phosphate 3-epimerase [Clostridia bacterium]
MVEISTSILSVEKEKATRTFYDLETAHTDYFHIDVMDGKFVQNNTHELMKEYANTIKQISNIPLDIHLMTYNVKDYIEQYIDLEPNIITFHIESVESKEEAYEIIKFIKENNAKVGISIKPNTKVEQIYEFLPYIHMILVMTVEPGLGGQKLIPDTLEKVKKLKQYIDENNIEIDIEVDGGIKLETAKMAKGVGANIIVSGSYIIKSEDYKKTISELKE